MGRTTIFNQLVVNIMLPVMIALFSLAFFNYQYTKDLLIEQNNNKNKDISREIKNMLKFQDYSLKHIESNLDKRMSEISNTLVNEYFDSTQNLSEVNLNQVREDLGMDAELEDIYVINKEGIVVNSTFSKDIGLNVYAFGDSYKNLLEEIRSKTDLHLERFSVEAATGKLKKYSYQATKDHEYLVELGFYSINANNVIDQFNTEIANQAQESEIIKQVDFFIDELNPVSFNKDSKIKEEHLDAYRKAMKEKQSTQIIEKEDGVKLFYEFLYITRDNSDLYSSAIIRLISDRSSEEALLRNKMITYLVIFGATILLLVVIILRRSKTITLPIINLVDKAHKIQKGDLSERVYVSGNNEITTLSESFNSMLEQLEESYNSLEHKVEERTKELSETNKKITDSIFYAKRIQTAILPSDSELNSLGAENFVLFKPMNIVSGDFYWISKKDEKVLVSAADCTGHGVPGAFMSMIGNTLLNKIVNENNITTPNNILFQLREEVIASLNQAKDDNLSKDGMDMTICAIDFKGKKLEFSGANNPLVIVRKGELIEYKGNKQPVGMQLGELHPFTNHEVDLEKGDMVYLFSDGFQDQFGGEKGRKFMKKRFKELLVSIAEKDTNEQHDILDKTIIDWIKNTRQIDDILVMGIRI